MLKFLLVSVMMVSSQVFAAECVDNEGNDIMNQPEVFQALIEKSTYCYEAVQLAEACAWGSSLDVSTAGLANNVCTQELEQQKPSDDLLQLQVTMSQKCVEKYEKEDGTMYRSMEAYCHLSVVEWILSLATPN